MTEHHPHKQTSNIIPLKMTEKEYTRNKTKKI